MYLEEGKRESGRFYGCDDTGIVASLLKVQWERSMWKGGMWPKKMQ